VIAAGQIRQGWMLRPGLVAGNEYFRSVADFVLHAPSDQVLFMPHGNQREDPARRLRLRIGGGPAPRLAYDPLQLAETGPGRARVFTCDPAHPAMREITAEVGELIESWRARTIERPLSIAIEGDGNRFRWRLGPYRDSGYSVLVLDRSHSFRNVRSEGFYYGRLPAADLMVRYESPEGWLTYSDVLHWDGGATSSLRWHRGTASGLGQ